jgi:SpoVK/Ycf46/Vps4 family AAA+-type ATPase
MNKDKKGKRRTLRVPTELQRMVRHIEPAAFRQPLTHSQETDLKTIRDDFRPDAPFNCLFAGECGTDKSMAAEVLARELHLDLLRIDLSAVVSKYIAETEKNLGRIFDIAEDGGYILFFDEADALFISRSEVKDSHDRYANSEINYLLQRMEGYHGPTILATNMKGNLDAAVLRRFRYVIDFPDPAPR